MTTPTDRTDPFDWPRIAWHRRMAARLRAWVCTWLCDGYDRRAGRIVDAQAAEIDRLRDLIGADARYPGGRS